MRIRRKILVCALLISMITAGCGEPKQIVNYPSGQKPAAEATEAAQENHAEADQSSLNYTIMSDSGSRAYEVHAVKSGDDRESYPVYEELPRNFSDEDLKQWCGKIFDTGSCNVIMPLFLTQSDYVESRRGALNERRDDYEEKGEPVPEYIETELQDLEGRGSSSNLNALYTMPYTNEIGWIDLADFYLDQMDAEVECRVCYVEGTIDGEYYRANFSDYQNSIIFRVFKLEEYYDEAASFYTMINDEHLPFDPSLCSVTDEDAVKISEDFLGRLGIDGYVPIAVYPACIYGRTEEREENPEDVRCGYACYFAREVNGRTRPYDSYIDDNIFFIPHYNNLLSFNEFAKWGVYSPLEQEADSGNFRRGYEIVRTCVASEGLIDFFWNSPSQVGELQTEQAQLLDFAKIDERAKEYLQYYYDEVDDIDHISTQKINRVELGMARTTSDDGHYYMVPAWYYFLESDLVQVEKKDIVCVNAIDGTIINVEHGGNNIS